MIKLKGFSQRDALESYGQELSALLTTYEAKELFAKPLGLGNAAEVTRQLKEGYYLLQRGTIIPNIEPGRELAYELIELLMKHLPENAEGLSYLKNTFVSQEIKCPDFISRVLNNAAEPIQECMQRYSLDKSWVEYFAIYLGRPYRAKAAGELLPGVDLSQWCAGYCPVCGHWPGLTKLLGNNEREFWCQHCATSWRFPAQTCPYCLSEHTMPFQIFSRHGGDLLKAMTCSSCRGYVKSYRPKGKDVELSPDVAWLATLELDEALEQEGFTVESPLAVPFVDDKDPEFRRYREDLLGAPCR